MRLPAATRPSTTRPSTTRPSTLPPIRSLVLLLAVLLGLLGLLGTVVPPSRAVAGTEPVGEWPLRPRPAVVAGFDPPADPWGAGHRGVDLLGHAGQPVRAALPGTVTYAGGLAGRGVVVVSHGTTRTTYEPVEPAVSPGADVAAGDRLGTLQATPSHCAPRACLHWGWIDSVSGAYLDPLRPVGAGPVRLLPFLGADPLGPGPGPLPGSAPGPAPGPAQRSVRGGASATDSVGFALDPRVGVL